MLAKRKVKYEKESNNSSVEKVKAYRPDKDTVEKSRNDFEKRKTRYWKPKEKNIIRVMPSWKPKAGFHKEVVTHFIAKTSIECLSKECVICKFYEKLLERGNDRAMKLASQLRPRMTYFMNIVDMRSEETIALGVRIFRTPEQIIDALYGYFMDSDYGDFTDSKKGYSFKFSVTNPGTLGARYGSLLPGKPSVLPDVGLLNELWDLDKVVRKVSLQEQKKLLRLFDISLVEDEEKDEELDDLGDLGLLDEDKKDEQEEKEKLDEDDIPF